MDRQKKMLNVLNQDPKVRYLAKLKDIDGIDPYDHKVWSGDLCELPQVTCSDIFAYLVCGVSAYTKTQFRNYRSLEAHQQFTNGCVQDLQIYRVNDQKTVVRTKVLHSQQLDEPPLQSWVILCATGEVESAHCTCLTGIAESCTHVAALLFKIEAEVRIREQKTETDVLAYWMMPSSIAMVQPEVGYRIDFTSGAAKRKALNRCVSAERSEPRKRSRVGSARSCGHSPTNLNMSPLLQILHAHKSLTGSLAMSPKLSPLNMPDSTSRNNTKMTLSHEGSSNAFSSTTTNLPT